jgi:hypothetical protein
MSWKTDVVRRHLQVACRSRQILLWMDREGRSISSARRALPNFCQRVRRREYGATALDLAGVAHAKWNDHPKPTVGPNANITRRAHFALNQSAWR